MILNIFSEMFTDMVTQYTDSLADHAMEKEIVAEDFSLDPEASWLTAIKKNLANQSLYNNVVKELLNGLLRDKKHFEVDALIENPPLGLSRNEKLDFRFNLNIQCFSVLLRSIGWVVLSVVSD